ncbi:MAG: DUF1343 domain-containing protein [Haliscomenobacter sp.]|nr:DUF1343 domain-containing protein [Haliscomenobacter sp.]
MTRLTPEEIRQWKKSTSFSDALLPKLCAKDWFFLPSLFIDKLAGGDHLRKQLLAGMTEDQIRATWEPKLEAYKTMRKKYLLYP